MRLRLPSLHEQEFMSLNEVAETFGITEDVLRAKLIKKNIIRKNGAPHLHWLYADDARITYFRNPVTKEIEPVFTSNGWFHLKDIIKTKKKKRKRIRYEHSSTKNSIQRCTKVIDG